MTPPTFARSRGPVIPASYFGIHYINTNTGAFGYPAHVPYSAIGQGAVRGWDVNATWAYLEQSDGTYTTDTLDDAAGRARDLGIDMHWTLGQSPQWASGQVQTDQFIGPAPPLNDADWRSYCNYMASRNLNVYGRAIKSWDVWNEPNIPLFCTATPARMAQLCTIAIDEIKTVDPLAKVYTPCPAGFAGCPTLEAILRLIPAADFDGGSMHLYTSGRPPESGMVMIQGYRSVMDAAGYASKPLIVSETTWSSYFSGGVFYGTEADPMPDALAAAYVARLLMCNWLAGARQTFFYGLNYAWSKIRMLDIVDPTIRLAASYAYQHLAGLLTGGTLSGFRASGLIYSAELTTGAGSVGRAYWCQDDCTHVVDLSSWSSGVDVLGAPITLSASYPVTHSPIFVFK